MNALVILRRKREIKTGHVLSIPEQRMQRLHVPVHRGPCLLLRNHHPYCSHPLGGTAGEIWPSPCKQEDWPTVIPRRHQYQMKLM